MNILSRMKQKLFGPLGAGAGAFILAVASTMSYLLGWLRDAIFARTFGITAFTDSYFKAFILPDSLLTIFITGALLGILIPLYVRAQKISEEEGAKTFGDFFFVLNSFYAIAAFLCLLFLGPILSLFFPETSVEQMPVLLQITKMLIFSNFFFALSNFLGHFLLAHKRFFAYSIAPLLYNLGIILGILVGSSEYGIYSAAYGGLFGAMLHFLLRLYDFLKSPGRFVISFDIHNPLLRELLRSMWPKVISLLSLQIGFYFFARMGDGILGEGNYSSFQYARNLQSFAVSLFGISFATAVFPFLADFVAEKKMDHFLFRLEKSLGQILFLALPSAVGVILIAPEIVRLVYGVQENNILTVMALIPLALAIPLESMNHLLVRAFHVLKNTFIPMIASLLFLTALISFSLLLVFEFNFGVEAFGIAYFLSFVVQVIFLFLLLPRLAGSFPWSDFFPKIRKTCFISAIMGISVFFTIEFLRNTHYLPRFAVAVCVGIVTYFAAALLLKSPEVYEVPFWKWYPLSRKKSQTSIQKIDDSV
ncbi:polysaccharide biosynthesis C-terminal domain-containing protein [Candidatus Peregrinibacteria bacterium]|nr:polysaccharide biosynthesis C-terminal domain-containing protein [Candidatus Peregrinibacteria bacterium]